MGSRWEDVLWSWNFWPGELCGSGMETAKGHSGSGQSASSEAAVKEEPRIIWQDRVDQGQKRLRQFKVPLMGISDFWRVMHHNSSRLFFLLCCFSRRRVVPSLKIPKKKDLKRSSFGPNAAHLSGPDESLRLGLVRLWFPFWSERQRKACVWQCTGEGVGGVGGG